MDDDAGKVASLQAGQVPFVEPGLPELVAAGVAAGRISFTSDPGEALDGAAIVFICVGTPAVRRRPEPVVRAGGGRTVARTPAAAGGRGEVHRPGAHRGAHPPGLRLASQSRGGGLDHPWSNPEFLREGTAVADTLGPDRIVVGADSEHAHQ